MTTSFAEKTAPPAPGADPADSFVLADAKDADMAFGIAAPGVAPGVDEDGPGPVQYRSKADYLASMQQVVASGHVDLLLASASNAETLHARGAFTDAPGVALAVRANDTGELWPARGGDYSRRVPEPLRTANLDLVRAFCDLVLYSITFVNDVDADHATLVEYARFREQATSLGLRHVLEVFDPASPVDLHHTQLGPFINDNTVRALAATTAAERPLMVLLGFHGARWVRELAEHDPSLTFGVVGVSAGTTRDAFELLDRARGAGARGALFGRRIQYAESQLDLLRLMREVVAARLTPEAAVHAYHEALAAQSLTPRRSLDTDLAVTNPALRAA